MASAHFLVLLALLAMVSAELPVFHACSGVSRGRCSVSEVRITPCANPKMCMMTRKENATISFDFTPKFSTSNLKVGIYFQNMRFNDMSDNACELTACPTTADASQTLNYQLYISNTLPKGIYPINFKIWNEDDPENDVCCFQTKVKIPPK